MATIGIEPFRADIDYLQKHPVVKINRGGSCKSHLFVIPAGILSGNLVLSA